MKNDLFVIRLIEETDTSFTHQGTTIEKSHASTVFGVITGSVQLCYKNKEPEKLLSTLLFVYFFKNISFKSLSHSIVTPNNTKTIAIAHEIQIGRKLRLHEGI
jgi:hypothetical protein